VVYVSSTASTHWLEADAAKVFSALQASAHPVTISGLAAAVEPGSTDADWADLEALVLKLSSLGLASIAQAPR
jgi:hypothetical protein